MSRTKSRWFERKYHESYSRDVRGRAFWRKYDVGDAGNASCQRSWINQSVTICGCGGEAIDFMLTAVPSLSRTVEEPQVWCGMLRRLQQSQPWGRFIELFENMENHIAWRRWCGNSVCESWLLCPLGFCFVPGPHLLASVWTATVLRQPHLRGRKSFFIFPQLQVASLLRYRQLPMFLQLLRSSATWAIAHRAELIVMVAGWSGDNPPHFKKTEGGGKLPPKW